MDEAVLLKRITDLETQLKKTEDEVEFYKTHDVVAIPGSKYSFRTVSKEELQLEWDKVELERDALAASNACLKTALECIPIDLILCVSGDHEQKPVITLSIEVVQQMKAAILTAPDVLLEQIKQLANVECLRKAAEEIAALDKHNYRENNRFWTAADAVGQLAIIAARIKKKRR